MTTQFEQILRDNLLKSEDKFMFFKGFGKDLQSQFPNGQWKTINGAKVFINNGKVVAGLNNFNGLIDKFFEEKEAAQKKEQEAKEQEKKVEKPEIIKKLESGSWNGKFYGQNIYINNKQIAVSKEDKKHIENWLNEKENKKKEQSTQLAERLKEIHNEVINGSEDNFKTYEKIKELEKIYDKLGKIPPFDVPKPYQILKQGTKINYNNMDATIARLRDGKFEEVTNAEVGKLFYNNELKSFVYQPTENSSYKRSILASKISLLDVADYKKDLSNKDLYTYEYEGKYYISMVKYDEKIKDKIKAIEGREYDSDTKTWSIPKSKEADLKKIL